MRYYHLGRVGYRLGDNLVVLGGISVFPSSRRSLKYKLYHFLSRRSLLNAVNISDEIADQHLKFLTKKKIEYIYGYASAIYLLACRAEKKKLKFPWIKACLTTSEMLLDDYREKIKSIFECEVMDVYGAGDGGISAYESESHIYNVGYNCIFETENNIGMNNSGDLLTTDLFNYATPFIRYRIGDQISILDPERAKIYYNGQIITKIWGRNWDVIKLENGNILTGIGFATFVFAGLNVRAYRVKKVGIMHIECELQKTELFSKEEENLIISEFKKQAGQECKVTVSYLEKFEPLPSGKKNYFIANVS
jgi:phenylacetate-CoA ligase